MKKKLITLLLLFLIPINVLAYSESVILGGNNIGINLRSKGILIVGYYKINDKYINKNNIKLGDTIIKINGEYITSENNFSFLINKYIKDNKVKATILRDGREKEIVLNLLLEEDSYKTGLYVKSNLVGIGTLTYIDPITKVYGALGHEIAESHSGQIINVLEGKIYESDVTSIRKSTNGNPGSKNAKIDYDTNLGDIKTNTKTGIYGNYTSEIDGFKIDVAQFDDIKKGKAYIYTVIDGTSEEKYEIEITNLYKNRIDSTKSIAFTITDKNLLSKSGGIVQGMSGSPIVQDNKLIGAVTNVLVDDVTKGYAVFIRTMLEEGDKLNEN